MHPCIPIGRRFVPKKCQAKPIKKSPRLIIDACYTFRLKVRHANDLYLVLVNLNYLNWSAFSWSCLSKGSPILLMSSYEGVVAFVAINFNIVNTFIT